MIPDVIPQDWADNADYYGRLASAPPRTPRPFISAASEAMAYTDDDTARCVPWWLAAIGITGLGITAYLLWCVILGAARAVAGLS